MEDVLKKTALYGGLALSSIFMPSNSNAEEKNNLQTNAEVKKTLEARLFEEGVESNHVNGSKFGNPRDPKPEEEVDYVVILNGSLIDHQNTVRWHYQNAKRDMGVDEKNIFILGNESPRSGYSKAQPLVTARGDKENLLEVINYLKKASDKNDRIFIYVTGHGKGGKTSFDGKSWIVLDDGLGFGENKKAVIDNMYEAALGGDENAIAHIRGTQINEDEYVSLLEKLKAQIVTHMGQCYGGGITDAIVSSTARIIGKSITDRDHPTKCIGYASAYNIGLREKLGDLNGDGMITSREIHRLGMMAHKRYERANKLEFEEKGLGTNGSYVTTATSADSVVLYPPKGVVLTSADKKVAVK